MKKNIQLFLLFLKIAVVTVGGGLVMLPLIEREVADKRGWLTNEEVLEIFAVAQSLPGIIAAKTAIYVGFKVSGILGAVFSLLGIVLPSILAVMTIAVILPAVVDNVHVQNALRGVTIGLAGMLLHIALNMARRVVKNVVGWALLLAAFIAAVIGINVVYIILFGAVFGVLTYLLGRRKEAEQ